MPKSKFHWSARFSIHFSFPCIANHVILLYSFEHSLVKELGYTGYERLRRAFDRAFQEKPPTFPLVVDAGCGTGLVGEQVRTFFSIFFLLVPSTLLSS
jgi:hypothetical protein